MHRTVVVRRKAPLKSMRLSFSRGVWEVLMCLGPGSLENSPTMTRARTVGGTWTRKALDYDV